MYDVCFRAVEGLPLPARKLTRLIIESIIARLIKAENVVVCSYVWMANHPHIQLYSLDLTALTNFHERLKKRLTDHLKRLLGLSRLRLWDDRTTLAEVLDLDAGIERIVYAYLNPVKAGLCNSIEQYQGANTWHEFLKAEANLNSVIEKKVPWIQLPDLEQLSSPNPSLSEERSVIERLRESTKNKSEILRIYPFRWLEAFKVSDPIEIEAVRQRIINRVREEEAKILAARPNKKPLERKIEGFNVTNTYIPPLKGRKGKDRKLFMFGSTKELRFTFLSMFRRFQERCKQCYELMKRGAKNIDWPPECFIPPAPRVCNPIG